MTVDDPTLIPSSSPPPSLATTPASGGDGTSCDAAVDRRTAPALRDTRGDRQARTVILGAGILGSALAWRLAARGILPGSEILVVDPNPPASQASSRAAALLSLSRPASKAHWIPLVHNTLAAFETLAASGHAVPLHRCGALHLAAAPAASAVLADHEKTAVLHGVRCERVVPNDCAPWLPWLDLHEFAEALWLPEEAYADSYLLANAYGAAARELGVRFRTGVRVRLAGSGESVGIEFPESRLQPASVWVVAGAWSSRVLSSVGLCAPQAAVRSQYWVTGPTPLARPGMPIVLAPDMRFYARREIGSILFGLREPNGVAAADALLPDDLQGFVFDAADSEGQATLEAFAPWLDRFAPGLVRSGLKDYVAGPSCYTPDGEFLVGALSGWSNLRLLSGCNGAGVATSAGLADLAADIEAGATVASEPLLARFDPGRFGAVDAEAPEFQANCVATRAGKTSG